MISSKESWSTGHVFNVKINLSPQKIHEYLAKDGLVPKQKKRS